jgi:hypothetical protein
MNLTAIEKSILDWFAYHNSDPQLCTQLELASVGSRETTLLGFFTELVLPAELLPFTFSVADEQKTVQGCGLFSPELDPYAECLLHTKAGKIVSLEVYAVAEGHPLSVSSFEIKEISINTIDLS